MSQLPSDDLSSSDGKAPRRSAERIVSDESLLYSRAGLILPTVLSSTETDDAISTNEPSDAFVSADKRPKKTTSGILGNILNVSMGICSSRNVHNQVVPNDEPIPKEQKPKVAHSTKTSFFNMMQSPKPKDMVDFVTSIQIEFVPEQQDESNIYGNRHGLFLVKYSDSENVIHPVTPFRSYLSRIISKETYSVAVKDFDLLSSMIDIVTILLENFRTSEDGFFSSKVSMEEQLVSLEACLALTVSNRITHSVQLFFFFTNF